MGMSDTAKAPQNRTQTEPVLLRFEPSHLEIIDRAAEHLGLSRAAWVRSTMLQAAREVLKQAS
jgi:uncharacterized protein (DUF1778 family)